uniref:Uncharacterized protein n=1 Tax=Noctiluca scintillans TaxID=2966 RepID=A0A7S1FAK1_NOCSC
MRAAAFQFAVLLLKCVADDGDELQMMQRSQHVIDIQSADSEASSGPFWKWWGADETVRSPEELNSDIELLKSAVLAAQRPVDRKLAELSSLEEMSSQISEEKAVLEGEIKQMTLLESSKEAELETLKHTFEAEQATKQKIADQKIGQQSSRADKLQSVKSVSSEIQDFDRQRADLEPSLAKSEEQFNLANASEAELKSQIDKDAGYNSQVSKISDEMVHLLKGATDHQASLASQLKKSEEVVAQLKKDITLKEKLMQGKQEELTTMSKSIQEMNMTILKMKDARDRKDVEVKEKGQEKKVVEQEIDGLAGSERGSRKRDTLEKQLEQLDSDIDMMVMDGVMKTKLVKTKSVEMSAVEQNVRDVKSERALLKHEMVDLEQKIKHEKMIAANLTEEMRSVDEDIAKVETQKTKTDSHSGGQVAKMKELKNNLRHATERKENLRRSVDDMKRQLRDISDHKAALQAKVATLQKEADFFAEKEVEQSEIEEAASEKVSSASDSLEKGELDLRKIRDAISRKRLKLKVKEDEKTKLSNRIDSVRKEKDRLVGVKMEKQASLDRTVSKRISITKPESKNQIMELNSADKVVYDDDEESAPLESSLAD